MHVFCDWLTIYQTHAPGSVPVVNGGRIIAVDSDGSVEWTTSAMMDHVGSHDSKVRFCSDGTRVRLSGNIGRLNRPDNVFGYSVLQCVTLANELLAQYGLPPFSASWAMLHADDSASVHGAVITRVDLTVNFATGSAQNCESTVLWSSGQKLGKFEPRAYGVAGTTWGEGSKWWYAKAYDKARDYLRLHPVASDHHDSGLYAWLRDAGIWRLELGLKSRYLSQKNLWRLASWYTDNWESVESALLRLYLDDLVGGVVEMDAFLNIPGRAGELACAWREGADLRKRLSRPTYYRYRKELLPYGIDIAVPCRVERLKTAVKLVELKPAVMPDFYHLPVVVPFRVAA